MGQVAAAIKDIKPAKEIMDEMMSEAVAQIQRANSMLGSQPKL